MNSTSIMNVTGNGQVSIPAATRSRWNADRVVVIDLGDRVVMRPLVGRHSLWARWGGLVTLGVGTGGVA